MNQKFLTFEFSHKDNLTIKLYKMKRKNFCTSLKICSNQNNLNKLNSLKCNYIHLKYFVINRLLSYNTKINNYNLNYYLSE